MTITLTEIKTQQDRLRQEIMEKECVLAALNVVVKHVASGRAPSTIDLGSLVSIFTSTAPTHELKELTAPAQAPEPPALPPPAPVERYVHPELKAISGRHGSDTQVVRWAIEQMTRDYSLYHICALLQREGCPLGSSKVSVVLSRLKSRGEIEEIRPGQGPIPALFRRADFPRPADFKPLDLDLKLPPGLEEKLLKADRDALIMKRLMAERRQQMAQASSPSH